MNCRKDLGRNFGFQDLAAVAHHPKRRAKNRLGRSRSETNEHLWPNESKFGFQPWPAGGDFA